MSDQSFVSISQLIHEWITLATGSDSEALTQFDVRGLELALLDVAERLNVPGVPPASIEMLGDFLLDMNDTRLAYLGEALATDTRFPPVARKLSWVMRRERGLSTEDSALRAARCEIIQEFLEVLAAPLRRRLNQLEHAKSERERYHRGSFPLMDSPELVESTTVTDPLTSVAMKESANEIVKQVETDLAPSVFRALRDCFLDSQGMPDYVVARRARISAASLSRARMLLRTYARNEMEGYSELCVRSFHSELHRAFAETA